MAMFFNVTQDHTVFIHLKPLAQTCLQFYVRMYLCGYLLCRPLGTSQKAYTNLTYVKVTKHKTLINK